MKKYLFFFLFVLSAGIFSHPDTTVGEENLKQVASITGITGEVYLAPAGLKEIPVETCPQEIRTGDRLRTGEESSCKLLFEPGLKLEILSSSLLEFAETSIRLNRGTTWVSFKKTKTEEGKIIFQVITPTATAGIKGTEFGVRVDESRNTEIVVTDGVVEVKPDKGPVINLEAGKGITISSSGIAGTPRVLKESPFTLAPPKSVPLPDELTGTPGLENPWEPGKTMQYKPGTGDGW